MPQATGTADPRTSHIVSGRLISKFQRRSSTSSQGTYLQEVLGDTRVTGGYIYIFEIYSHQERELKLKLKMYLGIATTGKPHVTYASAA